MEEIFSDNTLNWSLYKNSTANGVKTKKSRIYKKLIFKRSVLPNRKTLNISAGGKTQSD